MTFWCSIRIAALVIALSLTPTLATAASTLDTAAFDTALAAHDYSRATVVLNNLVNQRLPATDKAGPDPVLDRMYADLMSATGETLGEAALLERLTADPTLQNRGHFQILLATARESAGQFDDAERLYRIAVAAKDITPQDRLAGTLGIARLRMMSDPSAAFSGLATLPTSSGTAWEVDLQRARIAAIAGHDDDARASLERAWAEALSAEAGDAAPARVASDLLIAAGRQGDRTKLIAMLAIDRLNRTPNDGQDALAADAPICGTSGITLTDSVAIEFMRQAAPARPRFSLVWASRPAVAAPFMAAVARAAGFEVQDGQATVVTLRCRSAPSSDFSVRADPNDQIMAWSTGRGAYPLLETGGDTDPSTLAGMLADREKRYGSNSIMLLPVLVRPFPKNWSALSDNQDARSRAAAVAHRITNIIQTNGGPADLVLFGKLGNTSIDVVAQTKSVADAQIEFQTLLAQAAQNSAVSLDTLYTLVSGATAIPQAPSALRADLLERSIAVFRARAPITDPRVTALALRLLSVRREQGDTVAAAAMVKQYGFALDLCSVANPPVRFTSSNITPDDYPPDLVQTLAQGRTTLDFSISPSGAASQPRILVADPPYVFDSIAVAKSSTLIYEPARINGAAQTCRCMVQSVRWTLPD
ncbi:hypothetical protein EWE75_14030 [Sphingomonas populi]|uniref:TonB C-terminal domain-containing protein n=1 Tax=Sphingomonas populi TaxID=2484750 RepID=A0A4Q6Y146_9SPHN|nr:energy transducer TonB [Sphingomonas populi]RZF63902.1 hypothetical protein EWE75_14030 [Sphingomonas populi]